jgi:hypothetical protein
MAKPVDWNNVSNLTPGMKNLGNQFNRRWPGRDGASDGAWGDYQHQQGTSGHNPDDTQYHNAEWDGDSDNKQEIRAIDVDNTLNDPDVNMQMVIDHMRKLPGLSSVIRYMIYNRKIYKASNGFNPENYTGASAHTEHAHFSGAYTDASDENKTFDFKFDELGEDMPTAEEIASAVWNYKITDFVDTANPKRQLTAATWLGYSDGRRNDEMNNTNARAKDVLNALAPIAAEVDLDPSEIQAIADAIPTAEENAQAVVAALGDSPVDKLVVVLQAALPAEKLAELKAAL